MAVYTLHQGLHAADARVPRPGGASRDRPTSSRPRSPAARHGNGSATAFAAAGRAILRSEDADSDADLAEGFQYLLGLVPTSLGELYRTDARAPGLPATASDVVKVGMDNPDGALLPAPISDDGVFRVFGAVGSIRMLEFVVSGGGRPIMRNLDEFDVARDGQFRYALCRTRTRATGSNCRRGPTRCSCGGSPTTGTPRRSRTSRSSGSAQIRSVAAACLRTPTAGEIGEQLDALGTLVEATPTTGSTWSTRSASEGDNVIPRRVRFRLRA